MTTSGRISALALTLYAVASVLLLAPNISFGMSNAPFILYLWIAASSYYSLRLLTGAARLPFRLRHFRLLFLLTLTGAVVVGLIAALARGSGETEVATVDCGAGVRFVALHRGGFGSTWFDVIEMKQLLPMVYVTRALKQYERETVIGLTCRSGGGVDVQLGEFGKPDRIQALGL